MIRVISACILALAIGTTKAFITETTINSCAKDSTEGQGCVVTARAGLCFNKNSEDVMKKMWNNCPCSCMEESEKRLMSCCQAVSVNMFDTPENTAHIVECTKLCSHKLTEETLVEKKTMQCLDLLHVLTYCGLEGHDVRQCCADKGMSKKCQRFCLAGFSPAVCGQNTEDYMECLNDFGLNKVRGCYLENMDKKPTWDPKWKASCQQMPNGEFNLTMSP